MITIGRATADELIEQRVGLSKKKPRLAQVIKGYRGNVHCACAWGNTHLNQIKSKMFIPKVGNDEPYGRCEMGKQCVGRTKREGYDNDIPDDPSRKCRLKKQRHSTECVQETRGYADPRHATCEELGRGSQNRLLQI